MSNRLIKASLVISLLCLIYSCSHRAGLTIQPISEEFNREYLTGAGLDTNYFSTKDVMQYYQVSNYEGLAADNILQKLDSFAKSSFPPGKIAHHQKLTLLFYKKKMFVNYNDHLYESARDNDTRRLDTYADELLASITFERVKQNGRIISYKRILYDNSKPVIKANDMILIR